MNVSDRGAQCNRAIMIITDGAPDTYEDIFGKYNWPYKDVSLHITYVYCILLCPSVRLSVCLFTTKKKLIASSTPGRALFG